jgi:hypothetical protein
MGWDDGVSEELQDGDYQPRSKYPIEIKKCRLCEWIGGIRVNYDTCDKCARRIEGGEQW